MRGQSEIRPHSSKCRSDPGMFRVLLLSVFLQRCRIVSVSVTGDFCLRCHPWSAHRPRVLQFPLSIEPTLTQSPSHATCSQAACYFGACETFGCANTRRQLDSVPSTALKHGRLVEGQGCIGGTSAFPMPSWKWHSMRASSRAKPVGSQMHTTAAATASIAWAGPALPGSRVFDSRPGKAARGRRR